MLFKTMSCLKRPSCFFKTISCLKRPCFFKTMSCFFKTISCVSRLHYAPSMMSQGKTPWKDPRGSYSFCGCNSPRKTPSNVNSQFLRGLSRWNAPTEDGKTPGGFFPPGGVFSWDIIDGAYCMSSLSRPIWSNLLYVCSYMSQLVTLFIIVQKNNNIVTQWTLEVNSRGQKQTKYLLNSAL